MNLTVNSYLNNFKHFQLFLLIFILSFAILCTSKCVAAKEAEVLYNSHGRRDPFAPLVTQTTKVSSGLVGVESLDEVNVEGIVYDPKNGSIVVVNGSVLREGEEFGSVKVISIKSNGAVFSISGAQAFKPLYQDESKGK